MADNVASPVTTGTLLATDDIGGVHYPRSKMTWGADGVATDVSGAAPLPVTNRASEDHIGAVGGHSAVATATVTRPADTTAYSVGDIIANSTTAGSVTPLTLAAARINAGTGCIRRLRLSTTNTTLTGSDVIRVHFFRNSPGITSGDNAPMAVAGIAAIHLGYSDVTLSSKFTDGSKGYGVPAVGGEITFDAGASTTNLYAVLEARNAYTPISGEVFTLAVEIFRD